jgi:CRP-like cAMP-binding protein
MKEIIKERINEKKLYIPVYINQLLAARKNTKMRIPHSKEVAILKSRETFGELALMTNQPRNATAVCSVETTFAIIDKKDY